jgi:hypothetical protein
VKVVFFNPNPVPDNQLKIFLLRHYDAALNEPNDVILSGGSSGGSGISAQLLIQTLFDIYAARHPVVTLSSGAFDSQEGTTTFYATLPQNSLSWSVNRISDNSSPYEEWGRPVISYVTEKITIVSGSPVTETGYFVKVVFFNPNPVPDNQIRLFLVRYYDATLNEPNDMVLSGSTPD